MRCWGFTWGGAVVLLGAILATACGGPHKLAPGTGAGSGGAPGGGGAAATGGTGAGGNSGGAPGSGGGAAATGGSSTGGSSGGANGLGGAGGADCAPVPVPPGGKVCADILIDSAAAVTAAADCIEATGGVTISPAFVGTVELPRLRKVGQDVRRDGAPMPNSSDPAQTTRVRLPNVTAIGGDLWFYLDFNLVELDLRSVETIGGRAWVYRDTLIRTLRLDALRTVGEDFYIGDVFALPDCVAKGIASHVTAAQTPTATGATTPKNCHCGPVCGHVEQLCP